MNKIIAVHVQSTFQQAIDVHLEAVNPDKAVKQPINPDFECMICLLVVKMPVVCNYCQKLFCYSCLSSCLKKSNECPACRQCPYKDVQTKTFNSLNKRQIKEFQKIEYFCSGMDCKAIFLLLPDGVTTKNKPIHSETCSRIVKAKCTMCQVFEYPDDQNASELRMAAQQHLETGCIAMAILLSTDCEAQVEAEPESESESESESELDEDNSAEKEGDHNQIDMCEQDDTNEIAIAQVLNLFSEQEMPSHLQEPEIQQIDFDDIQLAEKIEQIQESAYKSNMYTLLEMGYKDFDKNMNALLNNNCNLDIALDELCL